MYKLLQPWQIWLGLRNLSAPPFDKPSALYFVKKMKENVWHLLSKLRVQYWNKAKKWSWILIGPRNGKCRHLFSPSIQQQRTGSLWPTTNAGPSIDFSSFIAAPARCAHNTPAPAVWGGTVIDPTFIFLTSDVNTAHLLATVLYTFAEFFRFPATTYMHVHIYICCRSPCCALIWYDSPICSSAFSCLFFSLRRFAGKVCFYPFIRPEASSHDNVLFRQNEAIGLSPLYLFPFVCSLSAFLWCAFPTKREKKLLSLKEIYTAGVATLTVWNAPCFSFYSPPSVGSEQPTALF